jgi:hypothetical protein
MKLQTPRFDISGASSLSVGTVIFAVICGLAMEPVHAQTIELHRLTVASNPAWKVSNAEVDSIILQMNTIVSGSSYNWDVPCPRVQFARKGNVIGDSRLLLSGTYSDLASNLSANQPSANVMIVAGIFCPITIAAGCGDIGTEPLIAGRAPGFDAQLWLHERGHNVGLRHSKEKPMTDTQVSQMDGMRIMFWQLGKGHVGKTSWECNQFSTNHFASTVEVQAGARVAAVNSPVAPVRLVSQNTSPGQNSAVAAPNQKDLEEAKGLKLTVSAFNVVGAPWVEGIPFDAIKALSASDLESLRGMMKGAPNHYWPQTIQILSVVGDVTDVERITNALTLPIPKVASGNGVDNTSRLRDLLIIKLTAPTALGILANRTQSDSAVGLLAKTTDMNAAQKLVGTGAAESLSRSALTALSLANTPRAIRFIESLSAPQKPGGPTEFAFQPDLPSGTKLPRLTSNDIARLRKTSAEVQNKGIESFIRDHETAKTPD